MPEKRSKTAKVCKLFRATCCILQRVSRIQKTGIQATCDKNHQKTYAAVVGQKPLTQPNNSQTFQFTAEQLTKFVANVVIQIAQPQVYYPNPKQDMLDLKSNMCRKVSNVAKTVLGVSITGKELFESIGSLSAPALPKPFSFTNTKANSVSKPTPKPPILKFTSPSSNTTKAVPKQPKATK